MFPDGSLALTFQKASLNTHFSQESLREVRVFSSQARSHTHETYAAERPLAVLTVTTKRSADKMEPKIERVPFFFEIGYNTVGYKC